MTDPNCLTTVKQFGRTVVHNICAGRVEYSIPFSLTDWASFIFNSIGVAFFLAFALVIIIGLVRMINKI